MKIQKIFKIFKLSSNYVFILSILVLLLTAFFLYFDISGDSINNDAQFWYERTQNFIKAVKEKDWENTFQNPKPGVTVMWLSGLSLDIFLNTYERVFHFRPFIFTYDTFHLVHFSVIAPLVSVILLSLILFLMLGKKLFDEKIVLYSLMLLCFQPFFIGLSHNFHADAILTAFMFLSFLFAMYFLSKENKIIFIILSGVFAALALLSKSSGIFLIPYIGLMFLIDYSFSRKFTKSNKSIKSEDFNKNISFYIKNYIIWFFFLCLTFYTLFPAMWIYPKAVLSWIFIDEGLSLVTEGRDGINPFWYYIEPLFRVLTPLIQASFFLGIFFIFRNFKKYSKIEKKHILLVLSFIFFFILQMSLAKQKMERYLLPILPFMAIVGGYGLYHLSEILKKYISQKVFILVVFILNLVFIMYFFPNYLLYPSEKGEDQFGCSLCSDIGDYLNAKPNAYDLKILSLSKKVHRLQPYVRGKVYTTGEILPNNWTVEYAVTANDEVLPKEYSYCTLEKEIGFRGTNYWKIYKCK